MTKKIVSKQAEKLLDKWAQSHEGQKKLLTNWQDLKQELDLFYTYDGEDVEAFAEFCVKKLQEMKK